MKGRGKSTINVDYVQIAIFKALPFIIRKFSYVYSHILDFFTSVFNEFSRLFPQLNFYLITSLELRLCKVIRPTDMVRLVGIISSKWMRNCAFTAIAARWSSSRFPILKATRCRSNEATHREKFIPASQFRSAYFSTPSRNQCPIRSCA